MRQFEMMEAPRHRDEARLLRVGREGVYLQAEDGLRVHLAGAERAVERLLGHRRAQHVELAADEASAPEGALAFLVAAPRVAEAGGARDVQLRAAGLLMALWMRLFADTA